MTDLTQRLTDAIGTIVEVSEQYSPDEFEAALDAACDAIAENALDGAKDLESVVDGIRWGIREVRAVDRGGSTILHIRAPRGVRITHEWREPLSDIGRASVLQTVREAMGRGSSDD